MGEQNDEGVRSMVEKSLRSREKQFREQSKMSREQRAKEIILGATQRFQREHGDCKNNLGSSKNSFGEQQEKIREPGDKGSILKRAGSQNNRLAGH